MVTRMVTRWGWRMVDRWCRRRHLPVRAAEGALGRPDHGYLPGGGVHDDSDWRVLPGVPGDGDLALVHSVRGGQHGEDAVRGCHAHGGDHDGPGADALRALPGRSHARASDGPEARQPAAVGAELLLPLHVLDHRPDVYCCLRPAAPRWQGFEGPRLGWRR